MLEEQSLNRIRKYLLIVGPAKEWSPRKNTCSLALSPEERQESPVAKRTHLNRLVKSRMSEDKVPGFR